MTTTMTKHASWPNAYWEEAARTAAYNGSRRITIALDREVTPAEALTGTRPDFGTREAGAVAPTRGPRRNATEALVEKQGGHLLRLRIRTKRISPGGSAHKEIIHQQRRAVR